MSKGGNLMLNVPLPGHGAPDADELTFLADFTRWMKLNGSAIYGTRPWKVYGEGPSVRTKNPLQAQGFNENKNPAYTAQDLRFTRKGDTLYAFALALPSSAAELTIKSLAIGSPNAPGQVQRVEQLGDATPLRFTRDTNGLNIVLPADRPGAYVYAFKISGHGIAAS